MFDVLVYDKDKMAMEPRLPYDMALDELNIFFSEKYPKIFTLLESFLN